MKLIRRFFQLHPTIIVLVLLLPAIAIGKLTLHVEATIDLLLMALDADGDGSITDETWYTTFSGKQDTLVAGTDYQTPLVAGTDYQVPLVAGTDYLRPTTDVDDTPVNGELAQPISSNWAADHLTAADPHTGYVLESLFDANSIIAATADNTPLKLEIGEQTVVGRATGGAIAALGIDSDLSEVSANDDTVPSAKAVKAVTDLKAAKAGDTYTGTHNFTASTLLRPRMTIELHDTEAITETYMRYDTIFYEDAAGQIDIETQTTDFECTFYIENRGAATLEVGWDEAGANPYLSDAQIGADNEIDIPAGATLEVNRQLRSGVGEWRCYIINGLPADGGADD